jgi:hypothetical protein
MSLIGDARQTLVDAIAGVLPGRTSPYPPGPAFTAPYVWVDVSAGRTERSGERSTIIKAFFPVWVAVDGADRAQVALLDDVVARVWDACETVAGLSPQSWNPRDIRDRPTLRAAVIDVAATITARTLSSPETDAAQVPPVPVEATT